MGVMTGLISSIGVGFMLLKCKTHLPKLWKFILAHQLLSDLIISALFVLLLNPTTATGLIAGVSADLFTSAGLIVASKLSCLEIDENMAA